MSKQSGFSPILIVILITLTAFAGGYFIYYNKSQSTVSTQISLPSPKSSPTATPSASPKSNLNIKSTPKLTIIPSPSPSSSSSPSQNPSPTIKPSPVPGVVNLKPAPGYDINMKNNQGYAAYLLLTDSNGDVLKDQSDFDFSWKMDDPNFGVALLASDCYYGLYDINPPCPKNSMTFNSTQTGSTKVRVTVTKKSENKIIGEGVFNITVN